MLFTFYILFSPGKNKFYIGHTGDLIQERIRRHNSNHKGFTGGLGDWQLFYSEKYASKSEAFAREREVKSWKSSLRIRQLINKP